MEGRVKFFGPQNTAGVSQEKGIAGYLMYKYHGVFETLNLKHIILACSFNSSEWGGRF